MDVERELTRANTGLQSGNLPEAERCFRRILKQCPDHAQALHMLGLIAHRRGETQGAAETLKAARNSEPDNAQIQLHLAEVLRSLGQLEEAIAVGREAVRLDPISAPAHNNLGLALQDRGQLAEAEACMRRAVSDDPDYARGYFNLGNVLRQRGQLDEAKASIYEALRIKPRYPQALNALGVILGEQCRFEEAVRCFHRAIEAAPGYVKPLLNLGNLMARLDRYDDAHSCFDRALQLRSDYLEVWLARANLLHRQDRIREEIEILRHALRIHPDDSRANLQLGNAYMAQFRFDEAEKAFQRALKTDGGNAEARANLAQCRAELCLWQQRDADIEALRTLTAGRISEGKVSPMTPHAAVFFPFSRAERLAIARSTAHSIVKEVASSKFSPKTAHRPVEGRPLRIGYLSSDFRENAMGHLSRRLYGLHDRNRFEVFAYSIGPNDGSEYRNGIAQDCDVFVELTGRSDQEAAQRIRDDGIHVLVDLVGFARGSRLKILAYRPAPIQAVYLYPGTMGGVFHDYLIGDKIISPPVEYEDFGEALVLLPHCYQVNDHRQPISERVFSRAEEALPEEVFVFCCFNKQSKIEPRIFDLWMRILDRVPGSVLWLLETTKAGRGNLEREAEARGIPRHRLRFAGYRPKPEHLSRHRLADLFLDTHICNAHTTASDALWSGVPLITCPGETLASRVAASLLRAIGLPELVVDSLDAYERLAVDLACRPHELVALKNKLRSHRKTHPLFDTPRFVRNLEQAYSAMWSRHVAGEEPQTIVIEEEVQRGRVPRQN